MKLLKEIIQEVGITQQEIADALEIKSLSTINLKINGKYEFTTREASLLKNLINSKSNRNYTIEDLFGLSNEETIKN